MGKAPTRRIVVAGLAIGAALLASLPVSGMAASTLGRISRYPLAANAEAHAVVAGPDGNLWFAYNDRRIGRMTPGGTVATFTHPAVEGIVDLAGGADGNVWFTFTGSGPASSGVGRITPNGSITPFTGSTYGPEEIVLGPDGNVWFTDAGGLGRITPSGTITGFELVAPEEYQSVEAHTIAVGADGRLWHDLGDDAFLGAMSTSGVDSLIELSRPVTVERLRSGPAAAVWFDATENGIGRVGLDGTVIEVVDPDNWIDDLTVGADGNMWAPAQNAGFVAGVVRITPALRITFLEVGNVTGLASGPGGDLWFTDWRAVGRLAMTAGPARRPDGRVRAGTGPWVGDGAYSSVPTGQVAVAYRRPGQTATLWVSAQNDGDAAERLVIRGQGSSPSVRVAYHVGPANVTASVVAGSYRTPVLGPGAQHVLRVSLTPTSRVPPGADLTRTVTVRASAGSARDVVVPTVLRTA